MSQLSASEKLILQKNILFANLSDEMIVQTLTFFEGEIKNHRRGEMLHRAGNTLTKFGLVLSGAVQVFMDDIGGNRMIMATVTAGETFGESMCFLKTEEQPISVTAVADCRILWMKTDALDRFCSGCTPGRHAIVHRFLSMIAQRALVMNDRIQILSKGSLRTKLIAFFSQNAHKYASDSFALPMDRSDMAAYLGVDRSALSRELSKMQQEGLISFHKNVFTIMKKMESN